MDHFDKAEVQQWLSESYYDMHGSYVSTLATPPTALEFSRLIHLSRPVVFRNTGTTLDLSNKWTDEYLSETMGNSEMSIALTPNGRADSVVEAQDGKQYFAEPHVEQMTMKELLSRLQSPGNDTEICYLQSQNGNIYTDRFYSEEDETDDSEFHALRKDIPTHIPWCSEALGKKPDAVNLWIGDGRSVTTIHSDPYENLYQVVRGMKHFTLLPPTEGWALKERTYPHATYSRQSVGSPLELSLSPEEQTVRWSSVQDVNAPGALPEGVHPLHVTFHPGDTLYLPAGYWHEVRQTGLTVALNYWYDVEMGTLSWLLVRFLREVAEAPINSDDVE